MKIYVMLAVVLASMFPLMFAKALTDAAVSEGIQRVKTAKATLERGRAALLRGDGSKLYSDAEHDERDSALVADFEQTISDVQELGYTQIREAEAALEALDSFNVHPMSRLDGPELERAGNLQQFIEQDVAQYPAADLEPLVRAAIRREDRALQAVWHRALLSKINSVSQAHEASWDPSAGRSRPAMPQATASELGRLRGLAEQLIEKLRDPREEQARKEYDKLIDRGRKLVHGVGEEIRDMRLEQQRQRLVASGNYHPL